jgi:hypothetical protein
VPEVLDFDCQKPVRSGPGLLHLTSLFPFVQLMPFIRYRTNDVVLASPSSCSRGDGLAVELLGRFDYSGILEYEGRRRLIISPLRVHDVLDELPLVNHDGVFDALGAADLVTGVGNPKFRTHLENGTPVVAMVEVELRVVPGHYPQAMAVMEHQLVNCLRQAHLDLSEGGPRVQWRVQLKPPGSLEAIDPSAVPQAAAAEHYE